MKVLWKKYQIVQSLSIMTARGGSDVGAIVVLRYLS